MKPFKAEDLFVYIFVLVLSIAMAMGSLAIAFGRTGWWTPVILVGNSILWSAMIVISVITLYRYIHSVLNRPNSERPLRSQLYK